MRKNKLFLTASICLLTIASFPFSSVAATTGPASIIEAAEYPVASPEDYQNIRANSTQYQTEQKWVHDATQLFNSMKDEAVNTTISTGIYIPTSKNDQDYVNYINNVLLIGSLNSLDSLDAYISTEGNSETSLFNAKVPINAAEYYQMHVTANDQIQQVIASAYGMSDMEKLNFVYDWIIKNSNYDFSLTYYDVYNLVMNKRGVCQSISLTFYHMCSRLGLDVDFITGISNNVAHSWNRIKMDGEWKYLDLTYDLSYGSKHYFLMDHDTFYQNHTEETVYD